MDVTIISQVIRDAVRLKTNRSLKPIDAHIKSAIDWLCAAQDATTDGGVALRYSLLRGWDASYPETTGYIIPLFFDYARLTGNKEFSQRAVRMADWELSIQLEDGSFRGGAIGSGFDSFVFDTGQILFGLVSAHKATGDNKYLDGAVKAGKWLTSVQDREGMWKLYSFYSIPHVYYTRVALALIELGLHTKDDTYVEAAIRNIDWALTRQKDNGWFDQTGFTAEAHRVPYTHTIAYTMEGILESGILLARNDYIEAIARSADSLCRAISRDKGFCYAKYDENWNAASKFSCLTGNAQIAYILLRLYSIYSKVEYRDTAITLNKSLCEGQVTVGQSAISGAIAGSYPIWGDYQKFAFPNWAAKFFVDSLLLEKNLAGK